MPRKKRQRRKKGVGSLVKRSGNYYLRLDVDGRIVVRALRDMHGNSVASKEEAEELAESKAQEIREEIAQKRENEASTPLAKVEALYLQHLPTYSKKRGKMHIEASKTTRIAPATLDINLSSLRQFIGWLKKEGIQALRQVEAKHVSAFMATKADNKESTYNRHLMALRAVFDVIPQTKIDNPFKSVEARTLQTVKEDTASKRRFERDELAVMQEKATGWIKCAMFVGFRTGKRMGDVVCLQRSRIDTRGFFSITDRKTGKQEEVYSPEALPALEEWESKRLLDWNRDNLTNTRYMARTFNISPATALRIRKVLLKTDFPDVDAWQAAMREAVFASKVRITKEMQSFLNGEDLPLASIPEDLSDFVFPRQAAAYIGIGRKRDRSAPTKEFQAFLSDYCGFNTKNEAGQTILGFHSLRVSNATYGKIAGQSVEEIQKRLAHSNQSTTNGYIQQELEEVRTELIEQHVPLEFPSSNDCVKDTTDVDKLKKMVDGLTAVQLSELLALAGRGIEA